MSGLETVCGNLREEVLRKGSGGEMHAVGGVLKAMVKTVRNGLDVRTGDTDWAHWHRAQAMSAQALGHLANARTYAHHEKGNIHCRSTSASAWADTLFRY